MILPAVVAIAVVFAAVADIAAARRSAIPASA